MASSDAESSSSHEEDTFASIDEDYGNITSFHFDDGNDLTATKSHTLEEDPQDMTPCDREPGTSTSTHVKLTRNPKVKNTARSMQLVKIILVEEYNVKEYEAKAAVHCKGCDIHLCRQWIERNHSNFTLLEEKSKEFEYACGMISKYDMKKFIVHQLMKLGVMEVIAKAAVQTTGCESFSDCRSFSTNVNDDFVLESAAAYDEEMGRGPPEHIPENFEAMMSDLYKLPIKHCPWEFFGVTGTKVFDCSSADLFGFKTAFEWLLLNQYDDEKILAISSESRLHQVGNLEQEIIDKILPRFVEQIATKAAIGILSDFLPKVVATAAVHHSRSLSPRGRTIHLDHCRQWARTKTFNEVIIRELYMLYKDENSSIASTPRSVQLVAKILVNENGIKKDEAAAAVQSQGCNIELCLHWLQRNHSNSALLEEKLEEFKLFCESGRNSVPDAENFQKVLDELKDKPIKCSPWESFGITGRLKELVLALESLLSDDIFGFETIFEWLLRNQYDEVKMEALEMGCRLDRSTCAWKNAAVRILSEFAPIIVAQAAVHMCSHTQSAKEVVDLDRCRDWARANNVDGEVAETTRELSLQYSGVARIASTPRSMQFVKKILVKEHGMKEDEAVAAVQCEGCDIELCLHWIKRNHSNVDIIKEKLKEHELFCEKSGFPTQTPEWLNALPLASCPWESFGVTQSLKYEVSYLLRRNIFGFDTFFEWLLQNQYDDEKLKGLSTDIIEEAAVEILSDFMPRNVAQAAVQSSGSVNLNQCRAWAKENGHDEEIVQKFSLQFIRKENIASTPRSVQLVKKILLMDYKMKENEAAAAVRCRGCNIALCLRWKEENCSDLCLLEEKSKELDYLFGMISEHEMKKWIVQRLILRYNMNARVAKASAHIKGCRSFRQCMNFALRIYKTQPSVIEAAVKYDSEMDEICPPTVNPENLESLLEELYVVPLTSCPWESFGFGLHQRQVIKFWGEQHFLDDMFGFETMFAWLLRNQYSMEKLQENLGDDDNELKELKQEMAVLILSDFMDETIAKASLEAYFNVQFSSHSVHLDWCRSWVTAKNHDKRVLEELCLLYSQRMVVDKLKRLLPQVSPVGFRKSPELQKRQFFENMSSYVQRSDGMMEHYYMDRTNWLTILSEAAVQATSSIDISICMKWIESNVRNPQRIVHLHQQHGRKRDSVTECLKSEKADFRLISALKTKGNKKIFVKTVEKRLQRPSAPKTEGQQEILPDDKELLKSHSLPSDEGTRSNEQESTTSDSHGSSEFGQNDFVRTSSLKIQKQHKIGPSGGEICLQECGINFPEGALKAEMEFIMSLDNNPENIPENSIPITPILGCRPSITFDRPVTVRMVTSASAVGNAEVMASLYEREADNSDWVEKRKVVLTNKNLIQFDVMHFSDDVVALSDDAGDQVDYHLVNDVYMKKGTGTIASIFFVDQGPHDLATEDMCKRGVVPMLMKAKEIIVKMGTEIKVGFASKLPHGTTVTACNSPVIKITPEFLKKRCHEVYYDLEDIPQGYEGIISLRYTLKLDQEEERLPVSTTWPIVISDKPDK